MQGNAQQGAADLANQINNLSQQLAQLSQRAVSNANVTKAFNHALGLSASGVSQYSRELNSSINAIGAMSRATEAHKRILDQATKSAHSFAAAQKMVQSANIDPSSLSRTNSAMSQSVTHMNAMSKSSNDLDKAMRQIALTNISKRIGFSASQSQQAAYNFTRNFSTPIIFGLREAFFSYSKLATESNRTTKLILDNFNQIGAAGGLDEQLKSARAFTAELGKDLDKITRAWGTSRVLVQSLAGDFAELGISSSIVLANLTRMTAETEKLGNLDISQSSEFIQTMYQTILRIRRETGKSVDINSDQVANEMISQLRGQLAVFNMIENKTVMSLRNISDAFPEVTAAATSFGLSMTEAMSLVIPMIGAGFQVGASANSVKVSLQRMVAMTKQNTQIINSLNAEMGTGFQYSAGVGMENIQMLTEAYRTLSKEVSEGGKGKQGALEFFSRLFGVRQGPRMETTFAQLAAFQTQLEKTGSVERQTADILQSSINTELAMIGSKKIAIKQFLDLSNIHRAAIEKDANDVLTAQAQAIQRGQIKAQKLLEQNDKANSDFISGMSTEVGKALMAQAFDVNSLAGRQFEAELKISQDTPEVRYRRAKESLMALGRAVVPVVDLFLKGLLPVLEKLASFLQNNPFVAKLASALLTLIALSGPLRMLFTNLKIGFGGLIGIFVKLSRVVTGTTYHIASLQDLIMNPNLLRGQQRVVQYLDGFLIKSKRGAKELRAAYDFSGISLPAKEAIMSGGVYGSDKAVNMKRLTPFVPDTAQFMDDLKVINAQGAAQTAAQVAAGAESGVTKGASTLSKDILSQFANAMHRFQGPNLFAGPNYFEGNIPLSGLSGGPGGPTTPRAPRGSGGAAIVDDLTPEESAAAIARNEARRARLRPPTVTTYPKGTLFPSSTAKSFNDLEKTLDKLKKKAGGYLFSPANAAAGAVQAASSSMKPQQAFNPAQLLSNISQNRIALGKDPLGPVAVQRYLSRAADNVTLSFDQIRSWYIEAGKEITDELEYAFSRGGVFRVSQETLDAVKDRIFQKGPGALFTLGGTDNRLKGGATVTNLSKLSKKVKDELAPIIKAVSDDIVYQVDNAINQSQAALNKLKVSKLFQGKIGKTNLTVSRLLSGSDVLVSDLDRARQELFIAIDKSGEVIQHDLGALNQYADDLDLMERNVRGKTHRFVEFKKGRRKYIKYVKNPIVESAEEVALREADVLARQAIGSGSDALNAENAAIEASKTKAVRPDYVFNKKVDEARLKIQKLREAKITSLSRVTTPPLPTTKAGLAGSIQALDELLVEQKQEIIEAKKKFQNLWDEANSIILQEMDMQSSPRGKARVQKAGAQRLAEIKDDFNFELDLMQENEKRILNRRNLILDRSPAGIQNQIDDIMESLPKDVRAAVQDVDRAISDEMKQLSVRTESRFARMKRALAGVGRADVATTRAAVPMNPMWNAISAPLDSVRYSGSRFFNDPRFQQPNAKMFDARRGLSLPSSIKSFFGMDRVKGVFRAPKSLSAAAITQGEQIIFQFAEQLEAQLGSVLANTAQADIKHITRVLQNLKPTSVSKDLATFMTSIVNLPQDQIEMAMGNTLTEIKRSVAGATGAGVGGKGMKAGSLQSWKAFLERMRRGSLGLDTDASGNSVVKGIREFFFSGKIKKGAINTTSVKGISTALESAFVSAMKGGFLGLGGKDDAGVTEVARRLTVESNRPGLSRQRATKKALKDAGKKVTESVDNALEVVDEIQNEIQEQLVAPVQKAVENVKPKVNVYKPGELFPGRAPVIPQAATVAPAPVNIRDLEKAGIIAPTTKKQAEKMIDSAQRELARQLGIDAQASGASAKIKKLSTASFEKEIERIKGMIAGEQQLLNTFTSPAMRKGPEKNLANLNSQLQKLSVARDKYIVAEAKLAEIASGVVPSAPSKITPTGATGATAPTAPPPRTPAATTPVVPTPAAPRPASGGIGKIIDIKKIGNVFPGPNLFQGPNIFDSNLSDLIPNFDEVTKPAKEAAEALAESGDTAAAAIVGAATAVSANTAATNATGAGTVGSRSLLSGIRARLLGSKGAPSLSPEMDFSKIAGTDLAKNLVDKKIRLRFDDSGAITKITRIKKLGGEMAISFDRANSILAGRLLPNFTRLRTLLSSSLVSKWAFALTGGITMAIGPAQKLLKVITATGVESMRSKARAAIDTLVESRGDKKTGVIRKSLAGLSGATGGINSLAAAGSKVLDIFFKIGTALLTFASIGLIIVPVIVVIFGLINAWKSAQGRLTVVTDTLKEAFVNIKDAIMALFGPIRDVINGFFGASTASTGFVTQGEKNAAMFLNIANAIKKATAFIKEWAETTGKAFMTNSVGPFLTRLINRFILLGGAIKSAFSGDKEAAGKKFKAFLYSLIYELLNFTKGVTDIIAMVLKGLIPVMIAVAQAGVIIFAAMFKEMLRMARDNAFSIAKILLKISSPVYKVGFDIADFATSGEEAGDEFSGGFSSGLSARLTSLIDPIKGGLDSALSKGMSEIGKKYAELMGQGINIPLAQKLKNPQAFKEALAYNAKQSADAATAAGESLGSKVAGGIKDKMKEIKDTLKGYFYSNVDAKFEDIIQQYVDALEKQKDQQLKAYDDQIAGIDALADAEARLTAAKEYETKRRELIDQRETDNQNYLVERRLAVYEGRVLDVRKLDRQEALSKINSDKEIQGLDEGRTSELQAFQRDLAKQAISNQKELAEKQFQIVLDAFDQFVEDVKNKSFATQQEFATAIQGVANEALGASNELSDAFKEGLGVLPSAIKSVTNPAVKMFSAAMDDLIKEASVKFGTDTNTKNPNSLLGSIALLAAGSEEGFKQAFSTTFAPLYVQPTIDAIAKISSTLNEKGHKNNISEIWQKAGEDAFAKLKTELNRDIEFPKILASFSKLLEDLKPLVKQIVQQATEAGDALSGIGDNVTSGYVFTSQDREELAQLLLKFAPSDAGRRNDLALNAPSLQKVVGIIMNDYDKGEAYMRSKIDSYGLNGLERILLQGYLGYQEAAANSARPPIRSVVPDRFDRYYGGSIGKFMRGGFLDAPASQGIPALLHGGEYIINHKAVEKFGKGNLEKINALKNGGDLKGFASGGYMTAPGFANGGYMTAPGFARGGIVPDRLEAKQKLSSQMAAQAERQKALAKNNLASNFIGPVVMPKEKSFWQKAGSVAKEIARPRNSFAIAGGIIGGILGLPALGIGSVGGSAIGAGIGGAIGEFTEQIFDDVRGFQPFNIAKNALMQGTLDYAGGKIMTKVVAPIMKAKFPGVGTYLEGKIARPIFDLFKKPGVKPFNPSILKPENIFDAEIANPRIGLPPVPVKTPRPNLLDLFDPKITQDAFKDGFAPRASAAFAGPDGAIDKQVLDLFDELDNIASGQTNKLTTQLQRDVLKARLQTQGLIPRSMESLDEVGYYNSIIDNLLGIRSNATPTDEILTEWAENMGKIDPAQLANDIFQQTGDIPMPKSFDPRIIPASREVIDFNNLQKDIAWATSNLLKDSDGVLPPDVLEKIAKARNIKEGMEWWLQEQSDLLLPKANQPIKYIDKFGPGGKDIYKETSDIFMSLRERMALAPKELTTGGSGGALEIIKRITPIKTYKAGTGVLGEMPKYNYETGSLDLKQLGLYVHKIGKENVVFGGMKNALKGLVRRNPGLNIKSVGLNPYEIANLKPGTVEGDAIANEWARAIIGYTDVMGNSKDDTFISALLYNWKRNKDLFAMLKFKQYESLGSIATNEQKVKMSGSAGEIIDTIVKGKKDYFKLKDLFVTHETPYPVDIDELGNLTLKPMSAFDTTSMVSFKGPYSGGPYNLGKNAEYFRDTLHFALNHRVTGHGFRENVQEGNFIISQLLPMLKNNPGALDNLYTVDTFFTPPPGQGLKFPAGTFKVVPIQKGSGISPRDELEKYMIEVLGIVEEASPGSTFGTISPEQLIQKYMISGGDHGSEDYADNAISFFFAKLLGVKTGRHFDQFNSSTMFGSLKKGANINPLEYLNSYYYPMAGENAWSRVMSRDPFAQNFEMPYDNPQLMEKIQKIYDVFKLHEMSFPGGLPYSKKPYNKRAYNGGYIPKFKKGGYLKFKEGGEVPSILHGGEYVLNAAAVKKYGLAHLEAMNQMRFKVPSASFSVPQSSYSGSAAGGMTTSTQNVNIYVDNFIGEPEWFNSMMKDYNTKILPKNQKAAGLENRVISTYNGLNRGQ